MWNKPFPIVRPLILVLLYLLWDAQWVQTEPAKERPGQNPSCGWFILDECQPVWEEWSFSVATVTLIMSTFQICESGKPSFLLEKGAVLSPHITTSAFQTHNDFEASTAKDRLVEECFHLSTPGEENNNVWHFYSMLTEKVHRHHLHWLLAQQTLSPHRPNQNTPCIKNTVCLNTCVHFSGKKSAGGMSTPKWFRTTGMMDADHNRFFRELTGSNSSSVPSSPRYPPLLPAPAYHTIRTLGCWDLLPGSGGGKIFTAYHHRPPDSHRSNEGVCLPGDRIYSQQNPPLGKRIVRPVWLQFILLSHFEYSQVPREIWIWMQLPLK